VYRAGPLSCGNTVFRPGKRSQKDPGRIWA